MFLPPCLRRFLNMSERWCWYVCHFVFSLVCTESDLRVISHMRQVLNVYWPVMVFVRTEVPFAIVRTLKSSNQWPCRLYQIHGETHRYIKHSWRGKGEDLWGWLPYGTCCLLAFFTYNPEVHLITDEKAAFAAISPHLYTLSIHTSAV